MLLCRLFGHKAQRTDYEATAGHWVVCSRCGRAGIQHPELLIVEWGDGSLKWSVLVEQLKRQRLLMESLTKQARFYHGNLLEDQSHHDIRDIDLDGISLTPNGIELDGSIRK